MEEQAPYQSAAPKGPRNLTPHIAAWLRSQGFTATEANEPHYSRLAAHWLGPSSERFDFSYHWSGGPVPEATCSLRVCYPDAFQGESLFTAQHVRRLKDVRQLLTGNVRYANARLLAKPAPTAASNPTAAIRRLLAGLVPPTAS